MKAADYTAESLIARAEYLEAKGMIRRAEHLWAQVMTHPRANEGMRTKAAMRNGVVDQRHKGAKPTHAKSMPPLKRSITPAPVHTVHTTVIVRRTSNVTKAEVMKGVATAIEREKQARPTDLNLYTLEKIAPDDKEARRVRKLYVKKFFYANDAAKRKSDRAKKRKRESWLKQRIAYLRAQLAIPPQLTHCRSPEERAARTAAHRARAKMRRHLTAYEKELTGTTQNKRTDTLTFKVNQMLLAGHSVKYIAAQLKKSEAHIRRIRLNLNAHPDAPASTNGRKISLDFHILLSKMVKLLQAEQTREKGWAQRIAQQLNVSEYRVYYGARYLAAHPDLFPDCR